MNNNNLTIERFIVWEENAFIGPQRKSESSGNNKQDDIIKEIKKEFVKNECEDIGKQKKKWCNKCQKFIELSNFYKNSKSKDGLNWYCIKCENIRSRKYHRKNEETRKRQILEYYNKNKTNIKPYHQKYVKLYSQRPENKIARQKKWEIRYKNDICFRIEIILRSRFYQAIKNNYKQTSIINLIGCSTEELRKYLESKFSDGMNWDNQGKWHIDHIKPCSSFDLTKLEEQKKCFHYTNLQPLWKLDNLIKGSKIL